MEYKKVDILSCSAILKKFSKKWPVGQAVKTPPFHGDNRGSIPVRVTKQNTG